MTNAAEVNRCRAGHGLSRPTLRYGELCYELIHFACPNDYQLLGLAIGRVVAACSALLRFEFMDYGSV